MPPPEGQPPNVERLDWRLTELEKKVDHGFATIQADLRSQLTRLEGTVERMTFVDVNLYKSEQRAQDKQIADTARLIAEVEKRMSDRVDATDKRVDGAEHSNRATLLYLVGIVLIILAGGLVRLALG